MRGRARAALGLALAGLTAACGPPARSPSETVDRYFRWLGRDPIRTLELVSPAFHASHSLRLVTPREMERWRAGEPLAPEAEDSAERAPARASDGLARARLAWLVTQRSGAFGAAASRLALRGVVAEERGDRARVRARVQPERSSAFTQHFRLSRTGPDGIWRIDAIEQEGVSAENRAAAFAAYPNEATRVRLERSLRRQKTGP
ncbi:MAG: hypothetical protein V3U03_02375 [Myxococcota bacterium]